MRSPRSSAVGTNAWEAAQSCSPPAAYTWPSLRQVVSADTEVLGRRLVAQPALRRCPELAVLRAAGDGHGRPDPVVAPDRDVVHERRVHAEERVLAHRHRARNHDVGGDEAVVLDGRVVPDVVAAPE